MQSNKLFYNLVNLPISTSKPVEVCGSVYSGWDDAGWSLECPDVGPLIRAKS